MLEKLYFEVRLQGNHFYVMGYENSVPSTLQKETVYEVGVPQPLQRAAVLVREEESALLSCFFAHVINPLDEPLHEGDSVGLAYWFTTEGMCMIGRPENIVKTPGYKGSCNSLIVFAENMDLFDALMGYDPLREDFLALVGKVVTLANNTAIENVRLQKSR